MLQNGIIAFLTALLAFGVALSALRSRKARREEEARERKYRILVENLPQRVFFKDRDSVFLSVNKRFAADFGLRPEDIIGKSDSDLTTAELAEKYRADDRRIMDSGQPETLVQTSPVQGRERTMEVVKAPVVDDNGRLIGLLGIFNDVTERVDAEEALVESEQRFRRLAETALDGINICEWNAATGARRLIFCNARFVEMSGYTRQQLEACEDLNQLVTPLPFPEGGGIIETHLPDERSHYGMASWKRPDGKENAYEWSAVSTKSGYNYVIYGFDRDVTERLQARRALLNSEQQYRMTMEAMGDSICVLDRDCRVLLANHAFEALSHRAGWRGGVVGRSLFEALPFAPASLQEDYQRVFDEGTVFVTEPTYMVNGEELTLEVRKIPVFEGNKVVRAISMARDVTARRRAERALEKGEREQAAVLDAMSEAVIFYDTDLALLWANRAATKALGADPSTMVGKTCRELWHREEADCSSCPLALTLTEGGAQEAEVRAPGNGGLWHVRRYPVFDRQGRMQGVVDVALDVTERKRFEESLAQWAAVAESTDDAMIATMLDGTIIRWNPGAARIYGYSAEEVLGSCILVLAPEERRGDLKRVFTNVASGERVQQYETANLTRTGDLINVAITMSPALDEAGQVTSISVIARDITEHVKLREELINLSLVDALTGLNNRRGFFHLAHQQLKVARRTQTPALLVFADVDNMKWINDSLGHKAGDRALTEAASVLRRTFRESDIIGRIGGDEFAVLAIEAGSMGSHDIVARLQRALETRNAQPNRDFQLSLSVGIVDCQADDTVSFEDIMAEADVRMYENKRGKKTARPGAREPR